jgi:hypothetical protein
MDAIRAAEEDPPTTELRTAAVGDRCTSCDSPLANDQRYCVNCGERRGKSRYSFTSLGATAPAQAHPEERPPPAHRSRPSAGVTLVAGVATLLLAMGVGVLIGHDNNSPQTRAAAPVQVVTVGGGASGGGTAASARKVSRASRKAAAKAKATKVKLNAHRTAAATAAAGKVLGSTSNLAPATVKQGDKCTHGAGCQSGKFTGNFFGGG